VEVAAQVTTAQAVLAVRELLYFVTLTLHLI
jgi:hypothetical protein